MARRILETGLHRAADAEVLRQINDQGLSRCPSSSCGVIDEPSLTTRMSKGSCRLRRSAITPAMFAASFQAGTMTSTSRPLPRREPPQTELLDQLLVLLGEAGQHHGEVNEQQEGEAGRHQGQHARWIGDAEQRAKTVDGEAVEGEIQQEQAHDEPENEYSSRIRRFFTRRR